jgi:hypothetical protein
VTDFRMSTTFELAPTSAHRIHEIDTPLIPATQVIARLGVNPSITMPMVADTMPDVDPIWRYLTEPADFFGVPTANRTALRAALTRFVGQIPDRALIAATVTLLDVDGRPDFVVTGAAVDPVLPIGVKLAGCEDGLPIPRGTDPDWLRMAARTTSRGALDQLRRWLNDRGFADGVPTSTPAGAPLLGVLIFDTAGGLLGIDEPEPTSVLDQLTRCGVIGGVHRVLERPTHADRAWWISPRFQTHPVLSIDDTSFGVDAEVAPPFLELR